MENAAVMPTYGIYMVYVLGFFLAIVVGVILLLIIVWTLYTFKIHHQYRHLPGPKRAHFYSGHVKNIRNELKSKSGNPGDLFHQWCMEYGPIYVLFFFTRPFVLACSTEAVKLAFCAAVEDNCMTFTKERKSKSMRTHF